MKSLPRLLADEADNIFNVPDGFQSFLDTGLLGAIVLTIIGSLAWRIVASSFPLAFMSNPVIYIIYHSHLLVLGGNWNLLSSLATGFDQQGHLQLPA